MADELRIRSLEDTVSYVQAQSEETERLLGIVTKTEFETPSDRRLVAVIATPFLTAEQFDQATMDKQVVLFGAFASGALPDRLVPIFKKRIDQGTAIVVVSDNQGDDHGILEITYAAGEEAYKAGALPLQKVNVKHHIGIKAALIEALNEGLRGVELVQRMRDLYSYKEGEQKPIAQWDDPGYVLPPLSPIRKILRQSGFIDDQGNYLAAR